MAFIKKTKIKNKTYYSLVEKIKVGSKWKIKTLESYGQNSPQDFSPTLIKGFAEQELKKIPDNSVNLIIIDPPFSISFDTNHRKNKPDNIGSIEFDDKKILLIFPDIVRELYRILKPNSAFYCFSRWDVCDKFIDIIKNYFEIKNNLIWEKNNWSMGDLTGAYAGQYENIIFAVKGKHKLNKGRHPDILKFDRVAGKKLKHSHQKPTDLLKFIITKSSKRGDVVIDCFMGSGSVGVACKELGRQFIGIELDERYFDIAKNRILKKGREKPQNIKEVIK